MTAVEWLQMKMSTSPTQEMVENINVWFAQAKEMEKEQKITLGKRCFYKGFEKAESDDANCFTAWREEAEELLTFKSE
jgi:hypothetical protein